MAPIGEGGGILGCKVSHVHANIVVRQLQIMSISFRHPSISSQDEVARDIKLSAPTSVNGSALVKAKWKRARKRSIEER
jgi:hypothetical protein